MAGTACINVSAFAVQDDRIIPMKRQLTAQCQLTGQWLLPMESRRKTATGGRSTHRMTLYGEAARRRAVTSVYTRLGMALVHTGQPKEAVVQLQRAIAAASGEGDLEGMVEIHGTLAHVYLQEKRYDEAHQAAQAALAAAERLADVSLQASAWLVVAHIQEDNKQLEGATTSYEHAIELLHSQQTVPTIPLSEQLRDAYGLFSEYLERRGENQRAFEMLKLAYRSLAQS
jgi:tetratricopeptide (TPR) repeat protein